MIKIILKIISSAKSIGTLNFILFLVGAFFLWFNWQMLDIFRTCGSIPESYACAVIAATIGECGICGWIRTNKDKKRDYEWEHKLNKKQDVMPVRAENETADNEEVCG